MAFFSYISNKSGFIKKKLSGGLRGALAGLLLGALFLATDGALNAAPGVWEGAASVAPYGELPERGYYASTSSFPRNTVIDVINLETGKSVQAIVASPNNKQAGGLVMLSRDAAEALGMYNNSTGRVRLSLPSDKIANSRYIDGRSFSGDPDFDPRAAVQSYAIPGVETSAIEAAKGQSGAITQPEPVIPAFDVIEDKSNIDRSKEYAQLNDNLNKAVINNELSKGAAKAKPEVADSLQMPPESRAPVFPASPEIKTWSSEAPSAPDVSDKTIEPPSSGTPPVVAAVPEIKSWSSAAPSAPEVSDKTREPSTLEAAPVVAPAPEIRTWKSTPAELPEASGTLQAPESPEKPSLNGSEPEPKISSAPQDKAVIAEEVRSPAEAAKDLSHLPEYDEAAAGLIGAGAIPEATEELEISTPGTPPDEGDITLAFESNPHENTGAGEVPETPEETEIIEVSTPGTPAEPGEIALTGEVNPHEAEVEVSTPGTPAEPGEIALTGEVTPHEGAKEVIETSTPGTPFESDEIVLSDEITPRESGANPHEVTEVIETSTPGAPIETGEIVLIDEINPHKTGGKPSKSETKPSKNGGKPSKNESSAAKAGEKTTITLVPTEPRPPAPNPDAGRDELPPTAVIMEREGQAPAAANAPAVIPEVEGPANKAPNVQPPPAVPEKTLPPEAKITPPPVVPEKNLAPEAKIAPPPVVPEKNLPPEAKITPPKVKTTPEEAKIKAPAVIAEQPSFYELIPHIKNLEKGKYYIQIGLLKSGEKKFDKKNQKVYESLGKRFPLVIQDAKNEQKLMIGPLNEGESNAILLRLKSSGIKEAFIRHG